MKKKHYQLPQMKVVKVKAQRMLCGSVNSQQNESYQEESEETTKSWYN